MLPSDAGTETKWSRAAGLLAAGAGVLAAALAAAAFALALAAAPAQAGIPEGFHMRALVTGKDAVSACVAPDGRIFFVEKRGIIHVVKNDLLLPEPLLNHDAKTEDHFEKGMFSMALDPDFDRNGYFYVHYVEEPSNHVWLSRFKATGDKADPASETHILDLNDAGPNYHHGGGLAISQDRFIYDARGNKSRDDNTLSKTINTVYGKILKVGLDGTIPADNPWFAGNTGAAKAAYAYGLRNPWTVVIHPVTQKIYFTHVHDSPANDALNLLEKGADYKYLEGDNPGLKIIKYGELAARQDGDAMLGAAFYEGVRQQFPAEYKGKLFLGNVYLEAQLWTVDVDAKTSKLFGSFAKDVECPIDVDFDANGTMYLTMRRQTENERYTQGKLIKVWYGDVEPRPITTGSIAERGLVPESVMAWSAARGKVSVTLLRKGRQSLELLGLDGRLMAKAAAEGLGQVTLEIPEAQGAYLLVWRMDGRKAVAKVVLE